MTKMEEWLLSIPKKDIIEHIVKKGCPWCPAVEYCKASPLRCCYDVLEAWAKEESKL